MTEGMFDHLAEAYDAMIDWPRRLKNEEPFFREQFTKAGVMRVLDAACGPGHHAAMFHSWGLQVEGADISSAMIKRARRKYGEVAGLTWAERSFTEPHPERGSFDAVICVGQSLALAGSEKAVGQAVKAMMAALKKGGLLIIQILNIFSFKEGPCVWQKTKYATFEGRDVLIVKGMHRIGDGGFVDMLIIGKDKDKPLVYSESNQFICRHPEALKELLTTLGAEQIKLHGDYKSSVYEEKKSQDIVLTAIKA